MEVEVFYCWGTDFMGPFHTFLGYLESTKVIDTFQNQANNTEEGITIFVPKDSAFNAIKKTTLSNLTSNQLKQVILFHASQSLCSQCLRTQSM